jgi:hypothetical protein
MQIWVPKKREITDSVPRDGFNTLTPPLPLRDILEIDQFADLLAVFGLIYADIHAPRLTFDTSPTPPADRTMDMLPLNPLRLFAAVQQAVMFSWSMCPAMSPSHSCFLQQFSEGFFINRDMWILVQRSSMGCALDMAHWTEPIIDIVETSDWNSPVSVSQSEEITEGQYRSAPSNLQADSEIGLTDHFGRMLIQEQGHVDVSRLRRSTRSTRYDGFRVPQISDTKKAASKVKPRKIPSVPCNSTNFTAASSSLVSAPGSSEVPAPTPISVIQEVGSVKCGIPSEELTAEKLQAPRSSSDQSK